ncbi:unnamed protein product [Polarella glacialis]|uniref:Catechol O-methyltransferase n=1 Tax=Polarella glacialis TaxID=89957 RepID=A0A813DIN7_POLGL|nr:unnamed protein product [Polarella glacialis]
MAGQMKGGKRKRHTKKPDLSKVKFKVTKKRGRTVVTPEEELIRTKADIEAEIKKLKEAKKEATQTKARKKKTPEPIKDRKALDYDPVDAGMRKDAEEKVAKQDATRAEREARRAKRAAAKEVRVRRGNEEVSFQDLLSGDFFGADGIAPWADCKQLARKIAIKRTEIRNARVDIEGSPKLMRAFAKDYVGRVLSPGDELLTRRFGRLGGLFFAGLGLGASLVARGRSGRLMPQSTEAYALPDHMEQASCTLRRLMLFVFASDVSHEASTVTSYSPQRHFVSVTRKHVPHRLRLCRPLAARRRLQPTAFVGSRLGRQTRWQESIALLDSIQSVSLEPGVVSYNAAITACGRGKQWEKALDIMTTMRQRGVPPEVVTFTAAINACGKCDHWAGALSLFRALESQSLDTQCPRESPPMGEGARSLQLEVCATAEHCYFGIGEDVVTFSSEIKQRGLELGLITYSACMSACSRGQEWRHALALLQEAKKLKSSQPDVVCFNVALNALERSRQWQLALSLFAEMVEHGPSPTVVTYSEAIGACASGRRWELALHLLSQDVIAVSTCMGALEEAGRWELSLDLFQEMEKRLLTPSVITFNAAISAAKKGELWQRCLQLLVDIGGRGYNPAIQACSDCGQWQQALALSEEMVALGLQPEGLSFSNLLMECEHRCLLERQERLLQSLGSGKTWSGSALAAGAITAAAACYFAASKRSEAHALLCRAAEEGLCNAAGLRLASLCSGIQLGGVHPAVSQPLAAGVQYSKELRVLHHVLTTARPGDAVSVIRAVEDCGNEVLGPSGRWLKIAGGEKKAVLTSAVAGGPPGGSGGGGGGGNVAGPGQVLEIGAYCGFSATRMAVAMPGVQITSLEVDPVHMIVARNIVAMAGMSAFVEVWTGHSKASLPRLAGRRSSGGAFPRPAFAAVFMDQRGSRYTEDLFLLHEHGLLRPGAVIVGDNVLKPGAPIFLWEAVMSKDCEAQILSVGEFMMPSEDWMSITVPRPKFFASTLAPLHPAELIRLHEEADEIREAATGPGRTVSWPAWASFAQSMKERLAALGIEATARAPGIPPDEPQDPLPEPDAKQQQQ